MMTMVVETGLFSAAGVGAAYSEMRVAWAQRAALGIPYLDTDDALGYCRPSHAGIALEIPNPKLAALMIEGADALPHVADVFPELPN